MTISYVHGDATSPPNSGRHRVIAHIINDFGAWDAGFAQAISNRWPEPAR